MLEIEIQLEPGGLWHKRNPDRPTETICGLALSGPVKSRDHGHARHTDLCPKCWERKKIDTARMKKLERELAEETGDIYYDPDDDPTDPTIETPRDDDS